jgi:hypothetical protein
MASAQAHVPGGGGRPAWGLALPDRPILLVDVDRLLETSADVELLGRGAPIGTWRDALGVVLELLTYARAILDSDLAILRHSSAGQAMNAHFVVEELPGVLASDWEDDVAGDWVSDESDMEFDQALFDRADQLLSAHQEMARVDLASPADVARVHAVMEEQLAGLTSRQRAVEARLRQIGVALIRQYGQTPPARDQPA